MTERFAIRTLCMNVCGPTSFEDLRTLDDGTVCESFVKAAKVVAIVPTLNYRLKYYP